MPDLDSSLWKIRFERSFCLDLHAISVGFGNTPLFQFDQNQRLSFPGPNLSTLIAPGSIFPQPAGFGENETTLFSPLWQSSSAASSDTVSAHGLLATLYIDTTANPQLDVDQVWSLSLFNTFGGPTNWAGSIYQGNEVPNPIITDGFIILRADVPEPSSVVLLGLAAISLLAVARRRKRA